MAKHDPKPPAQTHQAPHGKRQQAENRAEKEAGPGGTQSKGADKHGKHDPSKK